ncbi:bridge-like lipid transfer protein family member 3B isoform X2 [Centruroides vittatus]|uniref:bridge-like lipid transfer protein family member 3B isoform X2 n=1 Tax=Centruroides vittatus TaxID=120091 RepID=UPI00350FD1FC
MVSLLKNQILKHLSKFAKNLSPDKVVLSTLKGHCELMNLELDELVLTDVLELPSWLRITNARCNHVTVKIHWTKLKSVPIHLSLDEVVVDTETCEDLRTLSSQSLRQSYKSSGKYGFSERVIDGLTVVVNSVNINFKSPVFQASIQLSRVILESRAPNWKKADLRLSRIKDTEHGELLFFKQLDWQVLRIEAKARESSGDAEVNLTPLRLITNQGSCRITIKKKLSDCSVMGCRIIFILDDLLWVLTDAQLVAALHFANSLSQLVQQANELSKKIKAKRKLEQQPEKPIHVNHPTKSASSSQRVSALIRYFHQYDIIETSYHMYCGRIDLHLCDDLDPHGGSRKSSFQDGGALQITLMKLSMDYYPYHRAFGNRDHWLRYSEPSSGRSAWIQQLMSLFHESLQAKFQSETQNFVDGNPNKQGGPKHTSVHRAPPHGTDQSNKGTQSKSSNEDANRRGSLSQYKKAASQWSMKYLMSSCFVFRLEEYCIYKVSTSTTSRSFAHQKFLAYDKVSLVLPADMKSIHLEMTYYYFPGDITLPVPTPNIFAHVGPLQLTYDETTLLWLNTFLLNLAKCIVTSNSPSSSSFQSFLLSLNIRTELLMPQIIIPSDKSYPKQVERPKALHLQASRIVMTNCRIGDHASHLHLSECLESLSHGSMFFDRTSYPWREDDLNPIAERFMQQMTDKNEKGNSKSRPKSPNELNIVMEGHDMWSIHLDPCWADFTYDNSSLKSQTFVDPLPITLWIYIRALSEALNEELNSHMDVNQNGINITNISNGSISASFLKKEKTETESDNKDSKEADIYMLVHVHSMLNLQINHYQYLFLLRTLDSVIALTAQLSEVNSALSPSSHTPTICITAWWPQIDISLVLHSLSKMRTSDSADAVSYQDDLSLNEEIFSKKKTLTSTHSSFSLGECDKRSKGFDDEINDIVAEVGEERPFTKSHSDLLLNSHSNSSSPPSPTSPTVVGNTEKSDSLQKSLHSGTSAMRRGFCNLMASIDSVLTKNEGPNPDFENISHCDDDTLSVQSDFSSDSDQYVLVGLESSLTDEDPFHFHSTAVEIEEAAEVKEELVSSQTTSSEKRKEMISVVILKLLGVEVSAQMTENRNCQVVQCYHIESSEHPSISWESFHNIFSTRSRGWQLDRSLDGPPSDIQISLRYVKTVEAQEKKEIEEDFLSIFVKDINLNMLMSSFSGITDMLEDEVIPKPIPTRIIINNLKLHLMPACRDFNYTEEDRPSVYITSPGVVPLHFHLPGCLLERTGDGYIHFLPLPSDFIDKNLPLLINCENGKSLPILIASDKCDWKSLLADPKGLENLTPIKLSSSPIEKSMDCRCMQIKSTSDSPRKLPDDDIQRKDKEELERSKRQSDLIQSLETENKLLKEELQLLRNAHDNNIFYKLLRDTRDDVRRLEEEKKSLLDTLQVLQEELSKYEK